MLIQCVQDLMPCPPEYQIATEHITLQTVAELGVTPESLLVAYTAGIVLILTPALVGYITNIAIRLIRHL